MATLFFAVFGALVFLIVAGKVIGAPKPSTLSDQGILARLQSEQDWINRFAKLPLENRLGPGIQKQYRDKNLYIMELRLELARRHSQSDTTLVPVLQRVLELMRSGVEEEEAQKMAMKEFSIGSNS